jgi:hypothetical protein
MIVSGYMIWSMLFAPGHLVGPALPTSSLQVYRADLLGPIVPTFGQLVVPTSLVATAAHFVDGNLSENSSYMSISLMVLIGIFVVRWRRNSIILASTLLAAAAFVLSLGSRLVVDGHLTNIPMPEGLLTHVPLLDGVTPVRFSFVVSLFAAIVIAVGVDQFFRVGATNGSRHSSRVVFEVSVVTMLVASAVLLLPQLPFATKAPSWPAGIESTLDVIPSGTVVLTYPFTIAGYTEAMSWQAADGMRFRLIGGYATIQGGANFGVQHPPLLQPPIVQEYLVTAQYGASFFYPAPNVGVTPRKALCRFDTNYDVGAVVFWNTGAHSARVRLLFLNAFGAPVRTTHDGKVLVWVFGSKMCRS